ncbi:MAG: LuxR C-terminal-related transcriptional regulator, partial [Chloroflexales bacterium]
EGTLLHLPPGTPGVRLLPVPVRPWGYLFSALRVSPDADARAAMASQDAALAVAEDARCQLVYDRLTPRRRDVLRAFAEGLTPQQVANKLSIELSTVSSHQTAIYQECQAAWDLPATTKVDYRWVRDAFARFFERG